ncbi:MAG: hypothetical protein PUF13_07855 [Lachnospiraceae bacterium]|nr:hypothetical protein [Lachnospiraceae bacterium]
MSRKIRTVMEGNAFYEIDVECYEKLCRKKEDLEKRRQKEKNTNIQQQRNKKSGA